MLTSKNIVVKKHARVFSWGDINSSNEVWILFHGYGQNVTDFFEPFKNFGNHNSFIIPEGLSRFYQKGINGKVGASWMTSEGRIKEIEDQLDYLDTIYEEYNLSNKKINVFAFSQGAPTAARWIDKSKIKANRLIFWSGNIPKSLASEKSNWIHSLLPEFYIGNNDQFAHLEIWESFFQEHNHLNYTTYKGDHFFNEKLLREYIFKKETK